MNFNIQNLVLKIICYNIINSLIVFWKPKQFVFRKTSFKKVKEKVWFVNFKQKLLECFRTAKGERDFQNVRAKRGSREEFLKFLWGWRALNIILQILL